jgi:hypothetical protein
LIQSGLGHPIDLLLQCTAPRTSRPPLKSIVNAASGAGSTNFSLSSASPVMSN